MLSLGIDVGGTRVKAALLRDGRAVGQTASEAYQRPTREVLLGAISECAEALRAGQPSAEVGAVGICVPGVLDEQRQRVVYSANLPGLEELDLQALATAAAPGARSAVATDQIAAATDYVALRGVVGRLLAISLGAGVGAAVLDCDETYPLGRPLRVNGDSPGHIGQMDVSLDDAPPLGPDGGAGSLEAYLGAAALAGSDPATLSIDDPPVRALVRALRICHALYRPNEIALLGGVGIRLAHLADALQERVNLNLTRLARPGWRLGFGDDDFHAARGAARIAANEGDVIEQRKSPG